MGDYGHDLRFGTFITPQNRRPGDVVELAVAAEHAGLDLVTFQDHPYQPAFLDAWTLLSYVAARTETIHLSGNVLNLPSRPPAVLAKAVASLDLLSGGRVDLALGAGGFWDALVAMGVPRLTPGESVDALSEAIDVIRALWDTEARGHLRIDGEHYRLNGAKRGPAPAHDVPIWLGALKPRMLRLVGTKADGWLPSLAYLGPGGLESGNARIDDAAQAAGRDPREIRRLLNVQGAFADRDGGFLQGPSAQWVQQLLPLVLEQGVSAFILASDDRATIERWGHEVAPALREAVDAERTGTGTVGGRVRNAPALAVRVPAIDYDAVPDALAATAVEPGDRDYGALRSTYIWTGSPGLILRPSTPHEVSQALTYARAQDVPIAVRSGGHGISGKATNDDGIVIDLSRMNAIDVLDRDQRLVRIEAGARWGDVAAALSPQGLAISSGDYGDVGVGGLATTGGIGFFARSWGLTIDHVVAAEVVLADGSIVRADADHHPDLLWGLRGAGGNLGIVTAFEIEAAEIGDVVFAFIAYDASDTAGLIERWGAQVEASPRRLTGMLSLSRGQGSPVGQALMVWADDDVEAATAALDPFVGIAPVIQQQAHVVPYAAIVARHHGEHRGAARHHSRSALVDHLSAGTAEALAAALTRGGSYMVQARAVGGAVADVPADATAYAHRDAGFALSAATSRSRAGRLDEVWDALAAVASGAYLSFETDAPAERLDDVFPPATLRRLRTLKATYDPDNVFRQNFPIEPAT